MIVEIPSDTKLGGATQLFQYPGAPTFTTPVAVAIGPVIGLDGQNWPGYIFVADPGNPAGEIVRIPPGGGDLQPTTTTPGGASTSALSVLTSLPLFGGQNINTPNGVAVDAAGNVYVSDSTGNAVWEAPAVNTSASFHAQLSGLNAPAGLALDANGNLYVADSGNKQVLQMNRQNPVVPFGTVPESMGTSGVAGTPAGCPVLGSDSPCTGVLTVSNIGNQPVALASTFLGAPTPANAAFSVTTTCTSPIPVGTTCTISPKFTPATTGSNVATVSVNTVNTTQTMSLQAQGANPEVLITLALSPGTLISGTTTNYSTTVGAEAITATVAPFVTGSATPTGTVTFSWTVAPTVGGISCGASGSQTVSLVAGVATTTTFPALTAGHGLHRQRDLQRRHERQHNDRNSDRTQNHSGSNCGDGDVHRGPAHLYLWGNGSYPRLHCDCGWHCGGRGDLHQRRRSIHSYRQLSDSGSLYRCQRLQLWLPRL